MSRPPSDLPSDARLDELWRAASRDEPPAALDDALRAAARQAVHARPRSLASGPFGGRWRVPLAVAAVVVVSTTVTLLVVEQERDALRSPHEVVTAPTADSPERHRDEPASAREFSEPLAGGPLPARRLREPEQAHAPSEERKTSPSAPSLPGVRTNGTAAQAPLTELHSAEPPVLAREAGQADADTARPQRGEAPRVPAQEVGPAPAGAPPAEVAKRETEVTAKTRETAPAEAQAGSAKLQARSQESAPAGQPPAGQSMARTFSAAPPEEDAVADAQSLEPKAWIERILELRRQGRLEEAGKSLEAFRERYPAYPLPPELKGLP